MLHVDQEEPQQAVERFVEQYELVSPFLMIFTAGFFSVFFLSIKQGVAKTRD